MSEPALSAEATPARRTDQSVLLAGLAVIVGTIVFLWFAPDAYQVYKALHVIAIVIWVGGDITLTTLGIVFERRRDGETLAALGKMGAWVGTRVYTPALFAAFAFGVALIQKGNLGWSTFYIDFALVGWAIAATVGVGFVGPELGRIDKAGAGARAGVGGGGAARQAALHRLPLRHGAADPDRARHDGEAVVLSRDASGRACAKEHGAPGND